LIIIQKSTFYGAKLTLTFGGAMREDCLSVIVSDLKKTNIAHNSLIMYVSLPNRNSSRT